MTDHPSLICGSCGYSLQGLNPGANCPECGSDLRQSDINLAHRASNLRYACTLTACAFLVYAISAFFAVSGFEHGPRIYGINNWWLLLGWLTAAVFNVVAMQSYCSAAMIHPWTKHLLRLGLFAVWLTATISVLMLFRSSYKGIPLFFAAASPGVETGLKLSTLIPVATSLPSGLLSLHFYRIGNRTYSQRFAAIGIGMFALSATVVGLYLAIWLDWTIGLDLYLSSSAKTNDRIQSAIRAAVITSGLVSVFAVMICVFGYRRINERVPGHVRAD